MSTRRFFCLDQLLARYPCPSGAKTAEPRANARDAGFPACSLKRLLSNSTLDAERRHAAARLLNVQRCRCFRSQLVPNKKWKACRAATETGTPARRAGERHAIVRSEDRDHILRCDARICRWRDKSDPHRRCRRCRRSWDNPVDGRGNPLLIHAARGPSNAHEGPSRHNHRLIADKSEQRLVNFSIRRIITQSERPDTTQQIGHGDRKDVDNSPPTFDPR